MDLVTTIPPTRHSESRVAQILWFILIGTGAILFGLISATGSLIPVVLATGAIGGLFLLAAPRAIVWIVIVAGLAGGALISLAGEGFSKVPWAVVVLSFLLWLPVVFSLLQGRRIPAFIWLLFAFLFLSIASSALQAPSFFEFISGFRRYFQAYGLLFAMALLPFSAKDFDRWRVALATIAVMQLPFALYERFVLVPLRGGLDRGMAEATDVVAGTFGANMEGGSPNSLMVAFLLIAMAFAYTRWREGLLSGWKTLLFVIPCFIPLGLGETKIVLVLIPMILFVLHRKEALNRPTLFVLIMLAGAGLAILFAFVYAETMWHRPLTDVIEESVAYTFLNKGHGHELLNRTSALLFWWEKQSYSDPVGFLFGHGIGSAYTGLMSFSLGHIAATYFGYGVDLTSLSLLLWEVGLTGLALHLGIFAMAWLAAGRLARTTHNRVVRADATAIQAAVAVFVLYHYYTNSIVSLMSGELMVALTLGYLGHLVRSEEAVR